MKKDLRTIVNEATTNGLTARVDFKTRCVKIIGKEKILVDENTDFGFDDPIAEMEGLFEIFNHSIPSERTDRRRHSYFRALRLNQLSDEDVLYGERREKAAAELELCVLCAICKGLLNFGDGWFWQSKSNPSFIILKEWTEPITNNVSLS